VNVVSCITHICVCVCVYIISYFLEIHVNVEHLLIRYMNICAMFPRTSKCEIVGFFHFKRVFGIFLLHSCCGHFYDKDQNSRIGPKLSLGSLEVIICENSNPKF